MADQELTIKISAKNLTAEEFAKARKEILGLSDETDKSNKAADRGVASYKALAKSIAVGIAGAVAVVAALTAKIIELGQRGATVNDIRNEFDKLNRAIGVDSKQAIDTLDKAMDGTVSRFELMKSTNVALSQGLRVTNDDYKLIGESARVLADRVGGDAKTAFDTLITAMATGRDMTLKTIGLNIDAKQATAEYAAAIGKEVSALNEAEEKAAKQHAIMLALNDVMRTSGRVTLDFGDAVDRAKVFMDNFLDDLGSAIDSSDVLAAGLRAVEEGFKNAFGGNTKTLVKTIVGMIEQFAVLLTSVGLGAIETARVFHVAWSGIKVLVLGVMTSILGFADSIVSLLNGIIQMAASVPGAEKLIGGFARGSAALAESVRAVRVGLAEQTKEAARAVVGGGAFNATLDRMGGVLFTVRDALKNTRNATDDNTDATNENTGANTNRAGASDQLVQKLAAEARAFAAVSEQSREATKTALDYVEMHLKGQRNFRPEKASLLLDSKSIDPIGMLVNASQGRGKEIAAALKPGVFAGFNNLFSTGVPDTILSALTGGGNPIASVGSLIGSKLGSNIAAKAGGAIAGALGSTLGGALNTVLPGIGSMLGPLLGKGLGALGGALKNVFGGPSKKELEGREAAGSVREQLRATLSDQQKLEAGSEHWKQEIVAVRDAFVKVGKTEQDALQAITALHEAEKRGPEAVAQVYEQRILPAMKQVQDEQSQAAADQERANALMQQYGISVEETGGKFRNARMKEIGEGLVADFTDMVGILDMGVQPALEKMGPAINDFIQGAMKTGTEVPAAMKPMLEQMIEMGTLVDENGNKITSLEGSGLTFSESMTAGFEKVANRLDALLTGLGIELPKALETVTGGAKQTASELTVMGERGEKGFSKIKDAISSVPTSINVRVKGEWDGSAIPDGVEVPSFATEAFVRRPTLAVVGDAPGGEFVLKTSTVDRLIAGQSRQGGDATAAAMQGEIGRLADRLDRGIGGLRGELRTMPGSISRAVRDGLLDAL